jgi:hypothetical protein
VDERRLNKGQAGLAEYESQGVLRESHGQWDAGLIRSARQSPAAVVFGSLLTAAASVADCAPALFR